METTANLRFDPAHADQVAAWNGDEGEYWAAHADRFDRALARYQETFLAGARIGEQDSVLDVGCGTGQTTTDAARLARSGSVLGVDLSAAMLAIARERVDRAGLTNVAFLQADAQIHDFRPESFDVVLGRTSAMFFADKPTAFANFRRALRPGGRLVLLVWQPAAANEWIQEITSALAAGRQLPDPPPRGPQPFSMGDPDVTRQELVTAAFGDVDIEGLRQPMWFGEDTQDAVAFLLGLLGWLLRDLDEEARDGAVADLTTRVEAHCSSDGVTFESACWLIKARRA